MTRKTYLGTNREVFNIELYVIGEALDIGLKCGRTEREAGRQQTDSPWTRIHS